MGLFGTKQAKPVGIINDDGFSRFAEPSLDEASENMKDQAIEYIVSLNKTDKDKFFESVELIWQGYQIMEKVETRYQKALQRNAKASDDTTNMTDENEDELLGSFLDDPELTNDKKASK